MEHADQNLKALLSLWTEKRGKREMPARADLPASALKPWLGNLALIDLRSGDGPTFRLCGTNLRDRFGGEATGRKIESLEDGIATSLRDAIRRVRETNKPAQTHHKGETKNGAVTFHELCLPLADDGVNMDTVLFASYPEQKRQ
jgi:hypothetical protein